MLQKDVKTRRIEWIDALRTLACFTIVLLHVSVSVMLSGPLMLSGDCDYDMIKKKLIRLAIVFFSRSFVHIIHGQILNGLDKYSAQSVLPQFLQGHYHMWYLLMFVGLYLIAPLLRQITKDDKSAEAFVALALCFGCLIPSLNDLYQM